MSAIDQPLGGGETAVSPDQTLLLIQRVLGGEETGYVALYNLYAGMIYRLNMGLLQQREDAEEVLQDSFEYAFRNLHKYDPEKASFKTWLYQIAVSRCRNKRRRKWLPTFSIHQLEQTELLDPNAAEPDDLLRLSERQRLVWESLRALTPKLRETAVLRYYHELTYAEIGQVLGIPAKTAESRMRLAHKALRDLLEGEL